MKPTLKQEATQAQVESLAQVGCEEYAQGYEPYFREDLQDVDCEGITLNWKKT